MERLLLASKPFINEATPPRTWVPLASNIWWPSPLVLFCYISAESTHLLLRRAVLLWAGCYLSSDSQWVYQSDRASYAYYINQMKGNVFLSNCIFL